MPTVNEQLASLAAEVAAVKGSANAVVAAAVNAVNQSSAEYQTRIASLAKTVFISPATGVDTNTGTSVSPVKTLQKAVSMVPPGGTGIFNLQDPITIAEDVVLDNKQIKLQSSSTTRHAINFAASMPLIASNYYRQLASFRLTGGSLISISGLKLVMPDLSVIPGASAGLLNDATAFFKLYDASLCRVLISNCDIEMTATPFGNIVNFTGNYPLVYQELAIVLSGGATSLNGRRFYTPNNTAGTAVGSSYPQLVTNLATI